MAKKLSVSSRPEKLRRVKSNNIMLTKKLQTQLANLEKVDAAPDENTPEMETWHKAQVGKFYRPIKKQITLRLDADTLSWFKQQAPRYQTLINKVCRHYMEQNQHLRTYSKG